MKQRSSALQSEPLALCASDMEGKEMNKRKEYDATLPRKRCMFSICWDYRAAAIAFFKMRELLLEMIDSTDKHNRGILLSVRVDTMNRNDGIET